MKAVLISIQPKRCELIASEKKRIEVRKTRPKIETTFKCYIYCTKNKTIADEYWGNRNGHIYIDNGKVIGEFVCDKTVIFEKSELGIKCKDFLALAESCVRVEEMREYIGNKKIAYGWHISELKIYDKPRELGEFKAWRDCETPEKEYKNCTFGYRHPTHCEYCQRITRPPQSWCYVEELK